MFNLNKYCKHVTMQTPSAPKSDAIPSNGQEDQCTQHAMSKLGWKKIKPGNTVEDRT
jgi:hypothetical protein